MVISSHMCNSKSRKLNVEHVTNGSCTNISNLPSAILHHILSLMPTKDAVRTSVLSKRWQYMWKSISNLDFKQNSPFKRKLFMNFVERVLLLRDSLNVEKFSLSCSVLGDGSRINAWLSAALKHNVQELYICLSKFKEPFALPHYLFTCESLTTLEIKMSVVLKLPTSICLSRLKSLILTHITFPDHYSTQQLFLGCPVLEELCIYSCNWSKLHTIRICNPKLRRLTILEADEDEDDLSGRSCLVIIFGESLKYFDYTGAFSNNYWLWNASLLVTACIDVLYLAGCINKHRTIAYRAITLLKGVSGVKSLHLTTECVRAFEVARELFPYLPKFNNLTHLEVDGRMDFDFESTSNMLRRFPCLASVVFLEGICISANRGIVFRSLRSLPSCFSTHLKYIKIENFDVDRDALRMIKFFLKNATVLNEMVLCMPRCLVQDCEKYEMVKEQILNFPRASASCSVLITVEC